MTPLQRGWLIALRGCIEAAEKMLTLIMEKTAEAERPPLFTIESRLMQARGELQNLINRKTPTTSADEVARG